MTVPLGDWSAVAALRPAVIVASAPLFLGIAIDAGRQWSRWHLETLLPQMSAAEDPRAVSVYERTSADVAIPIAADIPLSS